MVIDEEQLDRAEPRASHGVRIGPNLRPFGHRHVAGRDQASVHFDQAEAADSRRLQIRIVAQVRYEEALFERHVQHRRIGIDRDGRSVDGNLDLVTHGLASTVNTAPKLHVSLHTPHLMHTASLIVWRWSLAPAMPSTGHSRAQAVQPLHISSSISNAM